MYNKKIGFQSYQFALKAIMDSKILLCLVPISVLYKQYVKFCEGICKPLTYDDYTIYMCNVFNLKKEIDYENNDVYFNFL